MRSNRSFGATESNRPAVDEGPNGATAAHDTPPPSSRLAILEQKRQYAHEAGAGRAPRVGALDPPPGMWFRCSATVEVDEYREYATVVVGCCLEAEFGEDAVDVCLDSLRAQK